MANQIFERQICGGWTPIIAFQSLLKNIDYGSRVDNIVERHCNADTIRLSTILRDRKVSAQMSTLYLGGSFNPIHHGHLVCARAVAEALGLEHVVLLPAHFSPHKAQNAYLPDSVHRLRMCQLATQSVPLFAVSDLEIRRGGPSYSIETVRQLAFNGVSRVNWMIGADQLLSLPLWREPEALMAEANLIVVARPGWDIDWASLPQPYQALQNNVVIVPRIDISATLLRERVSLGRSIDYLTPEPVVRYIHQEKLYREP